MHDSLMHSSQRNSTASLESHRIGKEQAITRNGGKASVPPDPATSRTIIRGVLRLLSGYFPGHPRNVSGAGKNRLDEGKLTEKWHALAGKCGAAVFRKTLSGLVRSREIVLRGHYQRPLSDAFIKESL